MISDFLYTTVLGMVLLFIGLWALILGIGFILSLRYDWFCGKRCGPTTPGPAGRT